MFPTTDESLPQGIHWKVRDRVYLDDILIYSKKKEEHMEHLEKVLLVLQEKELYAKGSKCDLFKTQVHFLGFIIGDSHIQTDPEKVRVMRDWKTWSSDMLLDKEDRAAELRLVSFTVNSGVGRVNELIIKASHLL